MKLKLSELRPNPFKKQISNGELNKEQVDKIKANIKELGFFGSLPVFKKDDKYYLIAGHHRTQALKEVYGKDWEVEVVVSNYNEDQIARGMVIENLTQRTDDYRELNANIVFVKNYLKDNKVILQGCRTESSRHTNKLNNEYKENVTANDISEWLDKSSGDVIKKNEINDLLRIAEKLSPVLEKEVEKKHDKSKLEREEDNLNYTQAVILSGIEDHKEQEKLAKVLKKTKEQRVREQGKLISEYKKAPEEIKEQIKEGKIDLADINFEVDKFNMEQSRKEKDKQLKVKSIKQNINTQINNLKYSLADSKDKIAQSFKYLQILSKYLEDMDEEQKERLNRELGKYEDLFTKVSELISKIRQKI
jgi:hypothetical protein